MPKRYIDRILRILKRQDYKGLKPKSLGEALGVSGAEYDIFEQALTELLQNGDAVIGARGRVFLPDMSKEVMGIFHLTSKGFGFIRPARPMAQGDLFIPPGNTLDAVSGDRVIAKVMQRGKREGQMRYAGRITEILERARRQIVGTLFRKDRQWFIQPEGKALTEPVAVDDPGAKNAKIGDKVVVEILDFPTQDYFANGVIIERLGKSGTSKTELKAIICAYQLEDKFSRKALNETRDVIHTYRPKEILRQAGGAKSTIEDIRNQKIITIDPTDARDFDDAISLHILPGGNWQLGVHIADVSHFVKLGGQLDEEARSRATSVYLPQHVIPMLPELLSNGICSLQEGQDRLVKSAYIKLDAKGKVLGTHFANSMIRSAKRLTYEEVDQILEGHNKDFEAWLVKMIKKFEELARVLQKRRANAGMFTLELPKAEMIYDDQGHVIDARPESRTFSHTMIEMFMLEANEAVARLLDSLKVDFLRRVHAEPDALAKGAMNRVIKLCGHTIPGDINREGLQKLLLSVQGKPESFLINLAVLKSMQKAEYSPAPIGHYALASRHYCHFTSPIRRYPDLTVHRLLQAWLEGRLNAKNAANFTEYGQLEELGKHCSERERNAESAENELTTVKLLQMLSRHVGDDVLGVVVSITNFGVFVQLEKYLIEGLILAEDVIRSQLSKKGKKGKSKGIRRLQKSPFNEVCPYKLGQEIKVRIAGVNVPARTLDLAPVAK
ncbi:MAG: ribonuclease R [Sedimentisphaerales bacterium]|nr:ribonuclease R [Sedimentisphaerales bacterium]